MYIENTMNWIKRIESRFKNIHIVVLWFAPHFIGKLRSTYETAHLLFCFN